MGMKWFVFILLHFTITQGQMFGGKNADEGQFPFMVQIWLHGDHWGQVCGGTIIDERWVLTARHCIVDVEGNARNKDNLLVVAGTIHQVHFDEHEYFPAKVIPFETAESDIGLLYFTDPFPVSDEEVLVDKIDIVGRKDPIVTTNCRIMGWGRQKVNDVSPLVERHEFQGIVEQSDESERLKYDDQVKIVSGEKCENGKGSFSPELHVCVGKGSSEGLNLQGDSGGPLVCEENDKDVVVGVFSDSVFHFNWENDQYTGMTMDYSKFVRMNSKFEKWIRDTMKKEGKNVECRLRLFGFCLK